MEPHDLSLGMTGPEVLEFQRVLNMLPVLDNVVVAKRLTENGVFDQDTFKRVQAFQASKKLPQTGVIDEKTWHALFPFGMATIVILVTPFVPPRPPAPRAPSFPHLQLRTPTLLSPSPRLRSAPPPSMTLGPRPNPYPGLHAPDLNASRLNVDWNAMAAKMKEKLFDKPVESPSFEYVKIPRLPGPLPVETFDPLTRLANIRTDDGKFSLFDFEYNHMEVVPGAQSTMPFLPKLQPRQDAYLMTIQAIFQRGPDDGANQAIAAGYQVGAPIVAGLPYGGPATFNPFIQFTDVDRLWRVGKIHFVQPYFQIGAQIQSPGSAHFTVNGGVFPINIGVDLNDALTLTFTGGLPFAFDTQTGTGWLGAQASIGLNMKYGKLLPLGLGRLLAPDW